MTTYIEKLPPRKASRHSGIKWTPAENSASAGNAGTLVIDTDRSRVEYTITEFRTDWQGRGFHLVKVTEGTDPEAESYDVFCGKTGMDGDSCDCKGFTYKRTCKHVDSCRALIANRWI